jgi:hypothetical protein
MCELVPANAGGPVSLVSAVSGTEIREIDSLILRSPAFDVESDARHAGKLMESAIALVGVRYRIGMDFGDRFGGGGITRIGAARLMPGFEVINDAPGLTVYEEKPTTRFFHASAEWQTSTPIALVQQEFARLYCSGTLLSERQLLAAQLFCASQFEATRTRFITLSIAVEVLAERASRGLEALSFLSEVSARLDASQVPDQEKHSLRSALKDLKEESISRSCRNLISSRLPDRKYLELDAASFFGDCYRTRCQLVHDGRAAKPDTVRSTVGHFDCLVNDLILADVGMPRASNDGGIDAAT